MAKNLIISTKDIIKINRSSRRKALKKNGGQDMFKPKVETPKTRYTRKIKHKGNNNS